ncbi:MAG TPA: glycosyltransferase family 2 protein [Magnetospirillaceae bacterium]|nr:glycosyltransferase family 2 protein [Magnetospirillaceae bacterium]
MKGSRPYVFCGLVTGFVGVSFIVPEMLLGAAGIILLIVLGQAWLHIAAALRAKRTPERPNVPDSYQPFVSIHLVYANEPANVVIRSLQRLAKLDYINYEVVVFHNNAPETDDVQLVRRYCQYRPDLFTFAHRDHIPGSKAGALEWSRRLMSPHTELIAIIDADYQVRPDFLRECTPYFFDPQVALVQTPQDYIDAGTQNVGLALEFRSFFAVAMQDAQTAGAVTFTGTMGLLRAELFTDRRLAWNTGCITEDTELGIRINQLGYRGVYINQSFGMGMLPLDYTSLRVQRQRWSYGNMQVLLGHLWAIITAPRLNRTQRISFLVQLTAWLRAELIIALCWILAGLIQVVHPKLIVVQATFIVLGVALASSFGARAIYMVVGMGKHTARLSRRWRAFVSHAGLMGIMSTSWLRCLAGLPLHFKVTNKNAAERDATNKGYIPELVLPGLLAVGLALQAMAGPIAIWQLVVVGTIIVLGIVGIWYVHHQFMANEDLLAGDALAIADEAFLATREEDGLQR